MKAKSQTEVGGKCPKNAQAIPQNGACERDEVGGTARDGNEERVKAKGRPTMLNQQALTVKKMNTRGNLSGFISFKVAV